MIFFLPSQWEEEAKPLFAVKNLLFLFWNVISRNNAQPFRKELPPRSPSMEILKFLFEPIFPSSIFVKHYDKSETFVSSIKLKMFVMTHCSLLRSDPRECGEGTQVRFGNKLGDDVPVTTAFWAQKPSKCFSNKQYSFMAAFFSLTASKALSKEFFQLGFFGKKCTEYWGPTFPNWLLIFALLLCLPCLRAQLELTELIYQKHQLHTNPTESSGAEGYQHS